MIREWSEFTKVENQCEFIMSSLRYKYDQEDYL